MRLFIFILIILSLLTLGCGYNIQTAAKLPFKEIYLRNIENQTLEPGLQDKMRKIAYKTLTSNGFNLSANADRVLDIQIRNFRYSTLSEVGLNTVEYQILMDIKATLHDKDNRKIKEFAPSSPFSTYFRTTKDLKSVIANKELAVESLLRDICEDLVRKLIFENASNSGI